MNEIKGNNIYCGPAAIAAIVGCNTDTAEKYIQQVTGSSHPVKGTQNADILQALTLLGYDCLPMPLVEDGSLFGAIPYLSDGVYLFNVPEHYVVIERKGSSTTIIDNHTKLPLKLSASSRLSQNVVHCWKITKVREVKPKEITYSKRRVIIELEVDTRVLRTGSDANLGIWINDCAKSAFALNGIAVKPCNIFVLNTPDE